MITNPAKFVFDSIDHMRTLDDKEKSIYFNLLIPDIMKLDNETVARIMFNIMKTFGDSIIIDHVPNFFKFHKKFGTYVVDSAKPGSDEHKKFTRLYTQEDIIDK